MEDYSAHNLLRVLRELHRIGYPSLRFNSFRRWIGTFAINFYREMSLSASSGEALYVPLQCFEVTADLRFIDPSKIEHAWGQVGLPVEVAARNFADTYLRELDAGGGLFDREYSAWLDLAIDICPLGRLPLTGEQHEVAKGNTTKAALFPEDVLQRITSPLSETDLLPQPPGWVGAIDPYKVFKRAMEDRAQKERDLHEKERFKKIVLLEQKFRNQ